MNSYNFLLGFFLWLTSSGLLLALFRSSKSTVSSKNNATQKVISDGSQARIQELEKQLSEQNTALGLAQIQIQELQQSLTLANEQKEELNQANNTESRSSQDLPERTVKLQREIEILKEELKLSEQQRQESEQKHKQFQKQSQDKIANFQAQVEALQEELQINSDQLELTQNKYFNFQQDFEQRASDYQDKIDILKIKNKKLVNKLEQLPKQLQGNWQKESIDLLQELLISYPTAKLMVELKHNLPSRNILALLKPVESLLDKWGIETIGQPWRKVPYNPNIHDCGEENVTQGELVYVRWVGYYQGDRVLLPAKVSRKLPQQR